MNKLPKDMINKLIDELSPQDFINFCASETSPNVERICHMPELWEKRLKKDFEYIEIIRKFQGVKLDPKLEYINLFSRISKIAETFTEIVLKAYGELRKYLKPEFNGILYQMFYQLCNDALKNVLSGDVEDEAWISESVSDTYHEKTYQKFIKQYFPGIKSRDCHASEFHDLWQDEIEVPLEGFAEEINNYLKSSASSIS